MMPKTDSVQTSMRPLRAGVLVLVAALALAPRPDAQSLPIALFERYLGSLREETGIPGLSVAVVQGRRVVWEAGLGRQDAERNVPARADTPYLIGDLTQSFAAVVLGQCVERAGLDINTPIQRWASLPESAANVGHVLSHTSSGAPGEAFAYDPSRFGTLAAVAQDCAARPFRRAVAEDIFERLGMADSIPGRDLAKMGATDPDYFHDGKLRAYESVLARLAVPYRVDRSGRATRSDYPAESVNAATGLVSTVRDLARFDIALDDNALISGEIRNTAWTNVRTSSGAPLPMGLGWFVQTYNGERLVWQLGNVRDAGSSLLLKIPGRELTLILLANGDGLAPPDTLATGDITASLYVKLFLKLFLL
jgi:CubicO group peptidase (beta-lactamase class C family)